MTNAFAEVVAHDGAPPRQISGVVPARAPSPAGGPAGCAFTGMSKVEHGHEDELASYLTTLGTNIKTTTEIAFTELRSVHFCRWVLVRDTAGATWLAFESNYDGAVAEHMAELVRLGARGIHRMYRHCAGYPLAQADEIAESDEPQVVSFLQQQAIPHAAFHVGAHGRTAERIRREAAIRDVVQQFLDAQSSSPVWRKATPEEMYEAIVAEVAGRGLLADASATPLRPPARRWMRWLLVGAAALALIPLSPIVLAALLTLRAREIRDPQDEVVVEPPGTRALAEREDYQVQNQLTHVVDVKAGLFRQCVLRAVLWVIDLLARYEFNQGSLGGITSIHFARWAFIDDRKRLLFFSNYDGSWESYLGDFIDKAAAGLTAVWSNTLGFPRASYLVRQGATDEERFKSWTRAHQVPTQLWYSAYPELTMFNIQHNTSLCAGLAHRPATPAALRAWLSSL